MHIFNLVWVFQEFLYIFLFGLGSALAVPVAEDRILSSFILSHLVEGVDVLLSIIVQVVIVDSCDLGHFWGPKTFLSSCSYPLET